MTIADAALFWVDLLIHVLRQVVVLILPARELLRWRGWRAALFLSAAVTVSIAVTGVVWLFPITPYSRLIASCLGLVMTYLICVCMIKAPPSTLLFAALLQANYGDCAGLVVRVVNLLAWDGLLSPLCQNLAELGLTALTLPALYLSVRRFVRPMLLDRENIASWRTLWLIPACYYLVFRLGVYPGYFSSDNRAANPWMLLFLLWPVLTFGIYVVTLWLIHSQNSQLAIRSQLEADEVLITAQQELYAQQRVNLDRARTLRHDMRHHLLAVQSLLAAGRADEADAYLSEVLSRLEAPGDGAREGVE